MTHLSSSLPQGEANGLTAISRELVENPHKVHVVLALVDCRKVVTDADTGDVQPTARIRRIEVVGGGQDNKVAQRMLRRALEERTGATVLPFDLEEDLRAAFGGLVDPTTGEIRPDDSDTDGA